MPGSAVFPCMPYSPHQSPLTCGCKHVPAECESRLHTYDIGMANTLQHGVNQHCLTKAHLRRSSSCFSHRHSLLVVWTGIHRVFVKVAITTYDPAWRVVQSRQLSAECTYCVCFAFWGCCWRKSLNPNIRAKDCLDVCFEFLFFRIASFLPLRTKKFCVLNTNVVERTSDNRIISKVWTIACQSRPCLVFEPETNESLANNELFLSSWLAEFHYNQKPSSVS